MICLCHHDRLTLTHLCVGGVLSWIVVAGWELQKVLKHKQASLLKEHLNIICILGRYLLGGFLTVKMYNRGHCFTCEGLRTCPGRGDRFSIPPNTLDLSCREKHRKIRHFHS